MYFVASMAFDSDGLLGSHGRGRCVAFGAVHAAAPSRTPGGRPVNMWSWLPERVVLPWAFTPT
jgi:hypothetical protein